MGPLHDPVTWYKVIYTGEQVAQWDFQNNATRTSSPGPAFVLKVPLRNLLTSIYNFVPCDRIVQRAHLHWCYTFCTGVTLFALVLHLNCTALSQSESSNFFMYIIKRCNIHSKNKFVFAQEIEIAKYLECVLTVFHIGR